MTNEELALLIQQGHTEYISQLWDNLYRLIYKLCWAMYRKNSKYFSHYGITADDVLQQSYFGFLAAVKAYSPDKGFKLTSYLHYHLVNCVRPLLTKDALNRSESLNVLVGEDENTEKQELLPDEHSTEPFDNVEQQSVYTELHALVNGLSDERQRTVIEQLYFSGKSQVQVGAEMNLSTERIRVLKNNAFRELRKPKNRKRLSELSPYQHKSLSRFKVTFTSEVEDYVERLERISNLSPYPLPSRPPHSRHLTATSMNETFPIWVLTLYCAKMLEYVGVCRSSCKSENARICKRMLERFLVNPRASRKGGDEMVAFKGDDERYNDWYSGTNQYRARGEELDDLLTGCVILGAEPVKDGAADTELMLYLKRQNGNLFLLRVSADNEESALDVFTASLPKEAYS